VSRGDGITWADWVRLVAAEHGVHGLTDDDVDFLLWERTAWPTCTETGVLRAQLVDALAEHLDRERERAPDEERGPNHMPSYGRNSNGSD
jgi:hypothetical protein